MNEELDSQLSAMFDDELPSGEWRALARRLSRDAALQAPGAGYAAHRPAAVRGMCAVGSRVGSKGQCGDHRRRRKLASTSLPRARRGEALRHSCGAGLRAAAGAASVAHCPFLWLQGGYSSGPGTLVRARPGARRACGGNARELRRGRESAEQRMTVPATELAELMSWRIANSRTPVTRAIRSPPSWRANRPSGGLIRASRSL